MRSRFRNPVAGSAITTHWWLRRERLQTLATTWFERHSTEYAGVAPNQQSVMESLVHSGDWADWELFLQASVWR